MDKPIITENKVVQTYAEDIAEVIESNQEGLVKKIIHGEEEHEEEKRNLSPESKKNKLFMILGVVLILLALATLSFFLFQNNINSVPVAKQFVPLIFNDQSTYIDITGLKKDEIAQTVLNEVDSSTVQNGGVEGIYLTKSKQIIWLRQFLSLVNSSFVPNGNPVLVSDNFLLGVENNGAGTVRTNGEGFFILLKMRSNLDIFDALRAWEANMLTDLHGFFGIGISSNTNYLFTKPFEDGIVENKNARLLYSTDHKLVLMYVYADDNSVIITNSPAAVHEIIIRLASSKKKQ